MKFFEPFLFRHTQNITQRHCSFFIFGRNVYYEKITILLVCRLFAPVVCHFWLRQLRSFRFFFRCNFFIGRVKENFDSTRFLEATEKCYELYLEELIRNTNCWTFFRVFAIIFYSPFWFQRKRKNVQNDSTAIPRS